MTPIRVTGAALLIRSLVAHGVDSVFANIGTDYAPVVEALAECKRVGERVPELILCQHENIAMSAAHGRAAATGELQVVFVHADVGTQNIGGAMHNASRAQVPILVIAGLSPYTTRGEVPGSRSAAVQFLQDVPDQAGIVRQYAVWTGEARVAVNIPQVVARAAHMARSLHGVSYLLMAREPLAAPVADTPIDVLEPVAYAVPQAAVVDQLASWLRQSKRPLIIAGATGRDPRGLSALVDLAESAGVAVVDAQPYAWSNFPTDHPHHVGPMPSPALVEADCVFVLESVVPWVPAAQQPAADAKVAVLGIDPLHRHVPLADTRADLYVSCAASPTLALLSDRLAEVPVQPALVEARRAWISRSRTAMTGRRRSELEQHTEAGRLTAATVAHALDQALGTKAAILHESASSAHQAVTQLSRGSDRRFFGSSGGSLGWCLGAAIGVRLALSLDTVVLTGDGTFVFANPTAAFWGARRYEAPFLTVILNNAGWNAVGAATLQQHPDGSAAQRGELQSSFGLPADLGLVAQSAGAATWRVQHLDELDAALASGVESIRAGTSAVVDVLLT